MSQPSPVFARDMSNKLIAGVCSGIARRFGWSPGKVRLLFVLSIILPGTQVLVYLVLWLLMPKG